MKDTLADARRAVLDGYDPETPFNRRRLGVAMVAKFCNSDLACPGSSTTVLAVADRVRRLWATSRLQ